MLPFVDTDEEFVWDLQGVSNLPSLFFHMCLKCFVDDRGAEFVKSRVRFKWNQEYSKFGTQEIIKLTNYDGISLIDRCLEIL